MASEREARRRAYLDKTAAETDGLAARGAIFGGNAFSEVLLVKGELSEAEKGGEPPLSGADGTALRASLERLGYAPEDWEWALTVDADGEPLDASLFRETVCALDPATLVCCDEAAANLAREAYADELALLDRLEEAMLLPGSPRFWECACSTSAALRPRSATRTRSRSCGPASRKSRRSVSRSRPLPPLG